MHMLYDSESFVVVHMLPDAVDSTRSAQALNDEGPAMQALLFGGVAPDAVRRRPKTRGNRRRPYVKRSAPSRPSRSRRRAT